MPSNIQLRYNGASFFMSTPNDDLLLWVLNWIKFQWWPGQCHCLWRLQRPPWCWPDWECAESLARNVMIARAARVVILSWHWSHCITPLGLDGADIYFTNHYSWSHVTHHPGDRQQTGSSSSPCFMCFGSIKRIFWLLFHIWCFDK